MVSRSPLAESSVQLNERVKKVGRKLAASIERGAPNTSDQSPHQHRSLKDYAMSMLHSSLIDDAFLGSHIVKTREVYTRGEARS